MSTSSPTAISEEALPHRLTLQKLIETSQRSLTGSLGTEPDLRGARVVLSVRHLPSLDVMEAASYRCVKSRDLHFKCPLGCCFPDEILSLIKACGYNNLDLIQLVDAGIVECEDSYTQDAGMILQRLYDLWCRSQVLWEEGVNAESSRHFFQITWEVEMVDDLLDTFPQYWAQSGRFHSYQGHYRAFLAYLEKKAESFVGD